MVFILKGSDFLKKSETVKAKRYFNEIIQNKNFIKNAFFIIYRYPKKEIKPYYGVAAGKKIGNAIIRNKLKRQCRNLIDNNKNLFPNNHDYIIMMREACLKEKFSNLNASFIELLKGPTK